jgi:phosphopantothenoylcysteine decarboxylase/phosphopantothenate--cysteine ligase
MHEQTMAAIEGADIFIAAAAVSDYRAETPSSQKVKKTATALQINLVKNPDILAAVSSLKSHPYLVGFAAESENLLQNAKLKLDAKNLDLIVANDISIPGIGFQSDENAVSLLTKDEQQDIAQSPKRLIAAKIIEFIMQKI